VIVIVAPPGFTVVTWLTIAVADPGAKMAACALEAIADIDIVHLLTAGCGSALPVMARGMHGDFAAWLICEDRGDRGYIS